MQQRAWAWLDVEGQWRVHYEDDRTMHAHDATFMYERTALAELKLVYGKKVRIERCGSCNCYVRGPITQLEPCEACQAWPQVEGFQELRKLLDCS